MSVEAVNRALAGDRMVLALLQTSDVRRAGAGRTPQGRDGLHHPADGEGAGRDARARRGHRARARRVSADGARRHAGAAQAAQGTSGAHGGVDARVRHLQELVDRALSLATGLSPDIKALVTSMDDPLRIAYLLASLLDMKPEDKQKLLEENDLEVKLDAVAMALSREIEVLELKGRIESRAEKEMTDAQRQYVLRQQMKAIQSELGEGDSEVQEIRDESHRRAPARARRDGRLARGRSARAHDAGLARVSDASHLHRLGARHPVGHANGRSARPDRSAPRPRRGSLRPRQGQGAHRRVPRRAEAASAAAGIRTCRKRDEHRHAGRRAASRAPRAPRAAQNEGTDPVLRRPPRRRQDVARPVDREGDEPEVRPHLTRRRT